MTCATCGEPAIVGLGQPPRWLCQEHFDQSLAATREALEWAWEANMSGLSPEEEAAVEELMSLDFDQWQRLRAHVASAGHDFPRAEYGSITCRRCGVTVTVTSWRSAVATPCKEVAHV